MMVIFLTGIVSLILMRTLRKDYAKYARETGELDELDQELDESGWKQAFVAAGPEVSRVSLNCHLLHLYRSAVANAFNVPKCHPM